MGRSPLENVRFLKFRGRVGFSALVGCLQAHLMRSSPRTASGIMLEDRCLLKMTGMREQYGGNYLIESLCLEEQDGRIILNKFLSGDYKQSELVLVDEDDEDDCINIRPQQEEPVERNKEVKIYYPSRKDPESVEICYLDIKCLAPATFLSSTIMNFYIRYLQRPVSATGKSRGDYHFSNTYFYGKLKEAVSNKNRDKGNFFTKFRRWWKGINIFQKAYILLPIHENLHWSLVIICIPDKEDESGPIVLHLDSLGYHNSRGIFQNIKRGDGSQDLICLQINRHEKVTNMDDRDVEEVSQGSEKHCHDLDIDLSLHNENLGGGADNINGLVHVKLSEQDADGVHIPLIGASLLMRRVIRVETMRSKSGGETLLI
ncbi:hypothetical protein GIB67_007103 [Kingdonia uniflora]|uniref:Ubiquitin-like protease family profile domain-containing protein n=1 Tax=Kingdonia uniflora TaxID=39325 RepID=A0A7J7MLA2_9MAGN|nr:hypothetical protein GIB67_007103 [Kingdonia uniflora]